MMFIAIFLHFRNGRLFFEMVSDAYSAFHIRKTKYSQCFHDDNNESLWKLEMKYLYARAVDNYLKTSVTHSKRNEISLLMR